MWKTKHYAAIKGFNTQNSPESNLVHAYLIIGAHKKQKAITGRPWVIVVYTKGLRGGQYTSSGWSPGGGPEPVTWCKRPAGGYFRCYSRVCALCLSSSLQTPE